MVTTILAILATVVGPALVWIVRRSDQRNDRTLLERDLKLLESAADPLVKELLQTVQQEAQAIYLTQRTSPARRKIIWYALLTILGVWLLIIEVGYVLGLMDGYRRIGVGITEMPLFWFKASGAALLGVSFLGMIVTSGMRVIYLYRKVDEFVDDGERVLEEIRAEVADAGKRVQMPQTAAPWWQVWRRALSTVRPGSERRLPEVAPQPP